MSTIFYHNAWTTDKNNKVSEMFDVIWENGDLPFKAGLFGQNMYFESNGRIFGGVLLRENLRTRFKSIHGSKSKL